MDKIANTNKLTSSQRFILITIATALFMEHLDVSILSTAIPKIAHSLLVDPIYLKVTLTSYLISLAIFIPISGWIADKYGTQKVFTLAITVFTLGSFLCGCANSLSTLIVTRVIQGFGGALMMPVARLILLKHFPKNELVRITNYFTIPSMVGPALGPIVGGIIVSYASWRWIFFLNIPFGLLGIYLSSRYMVDYKNSKTHPLNIFEFIYFSILMATLAFTIEAIGENVIHPVWLLLVLAGSLFLLSLYCKGAYQNENRIIKLQVFNIRTFRITVLGSFVCRVGIGGMIFMLALLLQIGLHYSALAAAFLLLPYALALLMMKLLINPILKQFGFKQTLITNTFLLALSIWQFTLIDQQTSLLIVVTAMIFLGLTTSLQFSCLNTLSYVDLDEHTVSAGTSIATSIQQLSMSLGIAVAALCFRYFIDFKPMADALDVPAFHMTFLLAGFITLMANGIFIKLHHHDGHVASRHILYANYIKDED